MAREAEFEAKGSGEIRSVGCRWGAVAGATPLVDILQLPDHFEPRQPLLRPATRPQLVRFVLNLS